MAEIDKKTTKLVDNLEKKAREMFVAAGELMTQSGKPDFTVSELTGLSVRALVQMGDDLSDMKVKGLLN